MATYGKKLLDATGNVILPKTRSNLVYHGSTLLSTKLNSIDKEISNIKNGTTKVAKATTADNANAVAWNNVSGKPSSFTPSSHNPVSYTHLKELNENGCTEKAKSFASKMKLKQLYI